MKIDVLGTTFMAGLIFRYSSDHDRRKSLIAANILVAKTFNSLEQ